MRRIFFYAIIVTFLLFGNKHLIFSQGDTTKLWHIGGMGTFTFSQVSLTNWASGGQNSMSANGLVSLLANYNKDKISWENTLDMAYGMIRQGKKDDAITQKSDDKIDFSSKFGRAFKDKWYYSAMLNFKTQMAPGYNYPNDSIRISDFMAPAYILANIGVDYKPNDHFTCMVAPVTGKITIVNSDYLSEMEAFGVEKGEKYRAEIGGYLKARFKTDVMENVGIETKVDLFSNYFNNPENIDINWETLVIMKINKYISANFNTHLIYDDDIKIENQKGEKAPRTQFKEIFGLGLSYKF